jgi:dihydrofolate reductase
MRKIIVGAQVSMDGVMQAPGGPTEDPTKGFKFGGWAMAHFDQESREELDRVFKEKFDLLLGRKTYEIFAAYWPYYDENPPHGSIAKLFNEIKKYAVSRSGEVDTSWQGSVLLRDIADVKRLKQEDGPNLVTQGSTELVHALLANDLVDAMSIFTVAKSDDGDRAARNPASRGRRARRRGAQGSRGRPLRRCRPVRNRQLIRINTSALGAQLPTMHGVRN